MTKKLPKLYIIHGWTYKPEPWHDVIADLKKLGVEAELLKVPGLGTKSDKVFTIEDYVKWAREKLPKGSIALGHSNGGRILLNLLSEESDYLNGIILLDAAGVWEKENRRKVLKALSKAFAPLKKSKLIRKAVHRVIGANDYENAPENMKKTLDNMINSDKTLDITKVKTPAQIIWGEDDNITPLRQGKKMHELLADSELTTKPGWRHSRYLVSTTELAEEIAKQLGRLVERQK
ncbi:MAG: alpha/beta hydrolase [Candidatus Saccharibacteria bacterium]|nr:alpha/beta hydrolase [Candidatus Saccharibacteria bacterium]